jgi:hypothetical protein
MKHLVHMAEEPSDTSAEETIPIPDNTILPDLDATNVSSRRATAVDRGH